jgi:hypothetical protein
MRLVRIGIAIGAVVAAISAGWGCGGGGGGGLSSGGGVTGSGLSLVRGNVSEVGPSLQANASAATELAGIRVTLVSSNLEDVTDDGGSFTLQGSFGGTVTIMFAAGDTTLALLEVDVPTAGTVDLIDVRLVNGAASPGQETVDFEAFVTRIDCAGQEVEVVSVFDTGGLPFVVDLGSSVLVEDDDPLACSSLDVGDRVRVSGSLEPDALVVDAIVRRLDEDDDDDGGEDDDGGDDDGGDDDDGDDDDGDDDDGDDDDGDDDDGDDDDGDDDDGDDDDGGGGDDPNDGEDD